jgi:hypothetical protein
MLLEEWRLTNTHKVVHCFLKSIANSSLLVTDWVYTSYRNPPPMRPKMTTSKLTIKIFDLDYLGLTVEDHHIISELLEHWHYDFAENYSREKEHNWRANYISTLNL